MKSLIDHAHDADAMQLVFNGTEDILDALHSLEGCEHALCAVLEHVLAQDPNLAHATYAIIDSIGMWREKAAGQAQILLNFSMGT